MGLIFRITGAFCIATVLTQLLVLGYLAARGSLDAPTMTKIVALVNGIDITGERLRQILEMSEDRQQPDFDEVLRARMLAGSEMDLRLRSQRTYEDELTRMLEDIKRSQARFDQRREAFEKKLDDVRQNAQEAGLKEVQRTIQALPAEQAKEQLLKFYNEEGIDDVVNIIQGIPLDIRKEIMAEFVEPGEAEKLHEVLRRIGNGDPVTSYVDEARGER